MTLDLDALEREMVSWRRDLHAHPEFGFEEKRTSAFVASTDIPQIGSPSTCVS